jgi:uncharacterized membrane-anchored protein
MSAEPQDAPFGGAGPSSSRRSRVPSLTRRARATPMAGVGGAARLDRRTKRLTSRLQPGDVAVIDHVDLDRVSADALVACRVSAVVNAAPSTSGLYPNLGPEIVLAAGIPLLDRVGEGVFATLREGEPVRLVGESLVVERDGTDVVAARGTLQDEKSLAAAMAEARAGLSEQLEAFATNTMEYLKRERDLLLDGVGVPEVRTRFAGRHVLLVVRGHSYKDDLAALRPYIREHSPVMVGVDGGADALREFGYRPDMVVGDMDSVSDAALTGGAEIVVHAYPDGRAPGMARVEALGVEGVLFPAAGTSEDVAMLLADEKGASLIVAVGTHATLEEFLDKGRAGMSSTFLTRMRVGGKLVDAKGVSRLYRSRARPSLLVLLAVVALLTLLLVLGLSPAGQAYADLFADRWRDFAFWASGLFS